jgi:translation initiation factor 5A
LRSAPRSSNGEAQDDYDVHHVDTGALERPCRVVDISKSKTGKHAKASVAGTDLFTSRRHKAHLPTSHDIEVPFVQREDYALINIDGKNTQLLDLQGNMREDVELGVGEVAQKLRDLWASGEAEEIIVTVLSALGEAEIIEFEKGP